MKYQESTPARCSSRGAIAVPPLWIVGPVEDESGCEHYFDDFQGPVHRVQNCLEFVIEAQYRHPSVVVCEWDLADGGWRDVLAGASSLPSPPPVIVTSRLADERLWAEVLNLGGYDVLAKPLDKQEVSRVLKLAWEHWSNRSVPMHVLKSGIPWKRGRTECSTA